MGRFKDGAGVVPLSDLPDSLIADIKAKGVWMCGVLVPPCTKEPLFQVRRTINGETLYSPFCYRHALYFAAQEGHEWPKNLNAEPSP